MKLGRFWPRIWDAHDRFRDRDLGISDLFKRRVIEQISNISGANYEKMDTYFNTVVKLKCNLSNQAFCGDVESIKSCSSSSIVF